MFCAVPDPRPDDESDAIGHGVRLVPLHGKGAVETFDPDWTYKITAWMRDHAADAVVDWWVGHDVNSGLAAVEGPKAAKRGRTALIHHMSYTAYQGFKHDDASDAYAKGDRQRALFATPGAHLFAVGPLLRDSCQDMVGDEPTVTMLVPGFAGEPRTAARRPSKGLSVVSFGRMEATSDRIKQGRLALAGFGAAARQGKAPGGPATLRQPTFHLIGLPSGDGEEARQARAIADNYAGRAMNVLPLPYDENRERLFGTLAQADVSMMLSWHEGFGLTGWEAIAAGVPVVVGENSGLFQLVKETLGGAGAGCLFGIEVDGNRGNGHRDGGEAPNHTDKDVERVRDAILTIAADPRQARENALSLRRQLVDKLVCTWENAGRQFLKGLEGNRREAGVPVPIGGGRLSGGSGGDGGGRHKPSTPDTDATDKDGEASDPTGGSGKRRRERSRERRLPILKREIRKAFALSGRVVEMLERALALPKPVGSSAHLAKERAQRLCDALLDIHFVVAINVLNTLYEELVLDEDIDDTALRVVADVSGWLFPWLYMGHAGFACDRFDNVHLGEVIDVPSDLESFAEIVMAGTDVDKAKFEQTRDALDWPKPVFSLQFGMVEEGRASAGRGALADEDNIRAALALKLNIPAAVRTSDDAKAKDDWINREIDFRVGTGRRWYLICAHFHDLEDRKRHRDLMSIVAGRYPGLAIIALTLSIASLHESMRRIQRLMGLMPEERP